MAKWRCEVCKEWHWLKDVSPAQILNACMFGGYYGHPRKEKEIVYAKFLYCEKCI